MNRIFSPFKINRLELKNRFVRSSVNEGMADEHGFYTPALTELLARLAANDVGLILSGFAAVLPEPGLTKFRAMACDDRFIPGFRQATAAVHAAGGKIFLQLVHTGLGENALSAESYAAAVPAFAAAARRAVEGGFDGVQLHAAHGYFLSRTLSQPDAVPGYDRTRLLLEVCRAVRQTVGPDFPVIAKINAADFVPGGFSFADCTDAVLKLQALGLDAIELSGGVQAAGEKLSPVRTVNPVSPAEPVYYESEARELRRKLTIPLILVGGIRYPETAERLVAEPVADLISLARPLICEPDLIRRWREGDRRPSCCISCNRCFRVIMTGRGCFCPVRNPRKTKAATPEA